MPSSAFQSGLIAAHNCIPIRCNPHISGTIPFAQWTLGWDKGKRIKVCNYGRDVGSLHVLDRLLYLATRDCIAYYNYRIGTYILRTCFRDLDTEEEREGTYR